MKQYRRRTTLVFAGLTVFSFTALVSLLALNPSPTLISRAAKKPPEVITLRPIIHECHITYLDCYQSMRPINIVVTGDSVETLDLIAKTYDLNPQLLLTLAFLETPQQPPRIDQSQITQIAIQLKGAYQYSKNQTVPFIFDHPTLGIYRLEGFDPANYLLLRYLSDRRHPDTFQAVFAPPKNDGAVIGFQEAYTALFNQNPLQP
jgi:hypothetical protein